MIMIDFATIETSVNELKAQFDAGNIDSEIFEKRLMAMVGLANDGHYWMFGHESKKWFRHDGQRWVPETPQADLLQAQTHPDVVEVTWLKVNFGWFITSLVTLVTIGAIVYASV